MKHYREVAKPEHYLKNLSEDFATMDIDAFVDNLFDNSVFTSAEALKARRAPQLQRGDTQLQHLPAQVPPQHPQQHLRLRHQALLRSRRGHTERSQGRVLIDLTHLARNRIQTCGFLLYRYQHNIQGYYLNKNPLLKTQNLF